MRRLHLDFSSGRVQLHIIYSSDAGVRLTDRPQLAYGLGRYQTGAVVWVRVRLSDTLVFDAALNPSAPDQGLVLAAMTKEDELDLIGLDEAGQPHLHSVVHNPPDLQRSLMALIAETRAYNAKLVALNFPESERRLWVDLAR